jgi:hypothetical protein
MKNVEIINALKELRFDYVTHRTVELDADVRDFLLDAVAARCGKASAEQMPGRQRRRFPPPWSIEDIGAAGCGLLAYDLLAKNGELRLWDSISRWWNQE